MAKVIKVSILTVCELIIVLHCLLKFVDYEENSIVYVYALIPSRHNRKRDVRNKGNEFQNTVKFNNGGNAANGIFDDLTYEIKKIYKYFNVLRRPKKKEYYKAQLKDILKNPAILLDFEESMMAKELASSLRNYALNSLMNFMRSNKPVSEFSVEENNRIKELFKYHEDSVQLSNKQLLDQYYQKTPWEEEQIKEAKRKQEEEKARKEALEAKRKAEKAAELEKKLVKEKKIKIIKEETETNLTKVYKFSHFQLPLISFIISTLVLQLSNILGMYYAYRYILLLMSAGGMAESLLTYAVETEVKFNETDLPNSHLVYKNHSKAITLRVIFSAIAFFCMLNYYKNILVLPLKNIPKLDDNGYYYFPDSNIVKIGLSFCLPNSFTTAFF